MISLDRTPKTNPKRRTVHRNRPQNRRTTHRAPKSSPKTAHRAPKSTPKTAHRTPSPTRRTSHQNPPKKASCARTKAPYSTGLGLDSPQVLSNLDRSCCPLAVIDPNISAPRTKIEPKKAHRAPKSTTHRAPKSSPKTARHTPRTTPKRTPCTKAPKAARTKIEPKNDAPCTEIGPKIGAPHTAHQNPAQKPRTAHQNPPQKRRTAHQNRARKGAPRTKIHPKGHHAPGPRPHIRQVSGSIPPRSSPILIDLVARWLWSTPTSAHHAPKSNPKRRTEHRNQRTTHRAPKSTPKTAHRTPKPSPKGRTSHQNPPERASCARTKTPYSTGLGLDSPQVLSNLDRSCCPLAVVDPNISAPRTKIDP